MPNALPAPVREAMDRWHDATVATERASALLRIADAVDEEAAARAALEARIGEALAAARQPREGERVMWVTHDAWDCGGVLLLLKSAPIGGETSARRVAVRPAPEETP